MYNKIVNPMTNRSCSIYSKKGRYILQQYWKHLYGGASADENAGSDNANHYPVAKTTESGSVQADGWVLISVDHLLYDKGMRTKISEVCEEKLQDKIELNGGFRLNKWDSVYKNIQNKVPLDPIIVRIRQKNWK